MINYYRFKVGIVRTGDTFEFSEYLSPGELHNYLTGIWRTIDCSFNFGHGVIYITVQ